VARKAFAPTEKDRAIVTAMASYGVPQEDIGAVIGIGHITLRKYFAAELKTAAIQANAKVAETCYAMATSGQVPAATFFWLKTRAGWRETNDNTHRFVDEHGKDRAMNFSDIRAYMQSAPDAPTG
jgi:hypothetical protein